MCSAASSSSVNCDRREVEVLRAQRVGLLLAAGVDRLVDGQLDAERLELGAVRVEAARERVLVHAAVALDVAPDLERRDRPALGHQVRDERQLPDQLLGVLRHVPVNDRAACAAEARCALPLCGSRSRSLRTFVATGMLARRVTKLVVIDDHEALRGGLEVLLEPGRPRRRRRGRATSPPGIDLVDHADARRRARRHPAARRQRDRPDPAAARSAIPTSPSSSTPATPTPSCSTRASTRARAATRSRRARWTSCWRAISQVADGGSYVDPRLDRILLSPRATARVPQLSPREREIMHLMAEGQTAEEIGARRSPCRVETVRTHVRNVIRKLQARNRVHAIAIALERGEIRSSRGRRPLA